jgi:hypothetical protein
VLGPEDRALAHSVGRVDGVVAGVDNRRMLHAGILADPLSCGLDSCPPERQSNFCRVSPRIS